MDHIPGCTQNLSSISINKHYKEELNIEHPEKPDFFVKNVRKTQKNSNRLNLVKTRSQKSCIPKSSFENQENQENLDPNNSLLNSRKYLKKLKTGSTQESVPKNVSIMENELNCRQNDNAHLITDQNVNLNIELIHMQKDSQGCEKFEEKPKVANDVGCYQDGLCNFYLFNFFYIFSIFYKIKDLIID